MPPLLSIRAYARHRADHSLPGASHPAVIKAIKAGRIHLDEQGKLDSEVADREWAANTGQEDRASKKPPAEAPRAAPATARAPPTAPADRDREDEELYGKEESAEPGMSLVDAKAIETVWKAKQAELDYRRQLGELVLSKDVADRLANVFTLCRTKVLGVPTRVRQAMPDLTTAQISKLEGFLREALEELANTTGTGEEDEEPEGEADA